MALETITYRRRIEYDSHVLLEYKLSLTELYETTIIMWLIILYG